MYLNVKIVDTKPPKDNIKSPVRSTVDVLQIFKKPKVLIVDHRDAVFVVKSEYVNGH